MTHLIVEADAREREDLERYRARGGYQGLERARSRGSAWVLSELERAGLRGRGGSGKGQATAVKWSKVAASPQSVRYVVANGAETSSVSQKDRFLMRVFPHRVLEGALAAAVAVGAQTAYLYVRGDAFEAIDSLERAVSEAQAAGLHGAGANEVDLVVHRAAVNHVAGEETAVIDALEGMEGLPQPKPPYPEDIGLRGWPSAVNNVETLAAAAAILRGGAERFRAVGTADCPGTALFTVAGDVAAPGVYEVPFGLPLRALLELAGAPPADEILAVLPGGLASGPLRPGELDVPLTYEALADLGSTLGPAAVVVLRRGGTGWPAFVHQNASFLAAGSCGQCRGCRDGGAALVAALERGDAAHAFDLAALLLHGRGNCAHPSGLARFALRALTAFRDEFAG